MDVIGKPLDALMGALGSLGDPTRLRLLRLLERRELGVADLVSALQLPQSTVSRHLKILSDQGWVKNRAEGTNRIYRMPAPEDTVAKKLWHVAKDQTEEWATAKQDQLRLDQLESRRPQEALAFFAGAAGTWDRLRSELYGNSFNDSALLSLIPSNWTVADLGCGSGILAARIAPHVEKVIGIDQSTAMLKAARKRTAAFKNVDLRPGSLESLPLADQSVDATLVVLALSYLKDTRLALAEMSRVLKPGGRAVVVDLLRHDREQFRIEMGQTSRGFSRNELHDLLTESGLRNVSCRPLAPEADAKGPALLLATAVTSVESDDADIHLPFSSPIKSQSHKTPQPKGHS
jgi:ArsR family transcriptional regulator